MTAGQEDRAGAGAGGHAGAGRGADNEADDGGGGGRGAVRRDGAASTALRDYTAAGELLRALAAPLRIAIVVELAEAPRYVHELVDALGAAQPLVSQHLGVLRAAGVVVAERRGREVAYSLADHHVAHIVRDAVSHAGET